MSALTIYSDKDASHHQWHSADAAEIAQQLNAKRL
ncbi:acireductone dioxygenase, partial [Enterobacter hormaechei]|nr:acireductone dioxygenase [Enterobacter hormaechei]